MSEHVGSSAMSATVSGGTTTVSGEGSATTIAPLVSGGTMTPPSATEQALHEAEEAIHEAEKKEQAVEAAQVTAPSTSSASITLTQDAIYQAIHQWSFDNISNSPVSRNTEAFNHLQSVLTKLPGYIMKGAT